MSLVCFRKLCGMLWVFGYWRHNNLTTLSLPPRFYLGSGSGPRLPPPSSGPEFIRPPQIHLRHFVILRGTLQPSNYPEWNKNQESRTFSNSENNPKGLFSFFVPPTYQVIVRLWFGIIRSLTIIEGCVCVWL